MTAEQQRAALALQIQQEVIFDSMVEGLLLLDERGRDWRPHCAALPLPGAAATADRRLELHHRALRGPLRGAEGRHGHLDSHLPAY